jgi:hypothetical protein
MLCRSQGAKIGSLQNEHEALEAGRFKLDGTGVPETWRQRWLGPLEDEQVEIGPLLGRGSYGKVYKGEFNAAARTVTEHRRCTLSWCMHANSGDQTQHARHNAAGLSCMQDQSPG